MKNFVATMKIFSAVFFIMAAVFLWLFIDYTFFYSSPAWFGYLFFAAILTVTMTAGVTTLCAGKDEERFRKQHPDLHI